MRLIDADRLKQEFEKHCYQVRYDLHSVENGMTITGILNMIDDSPTAYYAKDECDKQLSEEEENEYE